MGVWGVIIGGFGSSFCGGSLAATVCGSTVEHFSPTLLSKSLTESTATVGAPGLGGLPPIGLGTMSSPSFSTVGLLTAASSSKKQLVFSGLSTSGSVDGLCSSTAAVPLGADIA